MSGLELVPCTIKDAKEYVDQYHRHHDPPQKCRFAIAVSDGRKVVGVAIVGDPVARMLDDGWTAEVVRLATDGTRNAPSKLYGACWRAARAMGFKRLITYTLPEEGGVTLRASGARLLGECGGGSWSRKSRPRVDHHPTQVKMKWAWGCP